MREFARVAGVCGACLADSRCVGVVVGVGGSDCLGPMVVQREEFEFLEVAI